MQNRPWMCVLLMLTLGSGASAQLADPSTTAQDHRSPTLTITVEPERFGILDDFVIVAEITNTTGEEIQVRGATVCFEPEFIRARGIGQGSTCMAMRCTTRSADNGVGSAALGANCNQMNVPIATGASTLFRHYGPTRWAELYNWKDPTVLLERYPAILGWVQRSPNMSVEIGYGGADAVKRSVARQTRMEVSASLLVLLAGVVAGAALLAAFSWALARRKDSSALAATSGHALKLFLSGSITGVIFVILIQRIGDLDLPFKFAVNDVIGGLIVGLFSFKLSDALHASLFGDTKSDGVADPKMDKPAELPRIPGPGERDGASASPDPSAEDRPARRVIDP